MKKARGQGEKGGDFLSAFLKKYYPNLDVELVEWGKFKTLITEYRRETFKKSIKSMVSEIDMFHRMKHICFTADET